MSKINKRQIVKNVGSSWFSLGFDVLVGLFLSPFLLHWLGDTAFGIWVLIFSITGYYGLFDLGIRSSVVRYVSKFTATDDIEDLAKLINTSLFTYSCIGVLSLLVTVVLSVYVDHIFKIPPEFHSTARWLLLLVGASVGLGFPLGVVGGYLDGLQRFYVNNWANIAGDIARLVLIILAVRHGRGLLTIAAITVILPLILSAIRGVIAYRILPVPFGFKYVDRATFRTMANYSSVTLVIILATLMWAQAASGRVLFGISKHRTWAFVTLGEGIANLILSIILVRPYGIIGDALGTAIPLSLTMLFFMPVHLCRKLDIRIRTFVREAYTLPVLLCVPLLAALLLMRRWFIPHNYRQLGLQLFIAIVVYGLGLLWAFLTNRALHVGEFGANGSSAQAASAVTAGPEVYQADA